MKDGQCPMCGSREVYASLTDNVQAGPALVEVTDGLVFVPYLCRSCGFTALYVDDMDDVQSLSEVWKKIS